MKGNATWIKIISRGRGREKAKCLQAFAGILIREGAKTGLDQEKQEQQMVEEQSRTCHANKEYTTVHVALITIEKVNWVVGLNYAVLIMALSQKVKKGLM